MERTLTGKIELHGRKKLLVITSDEKRLLREIIDKSSGGSRYSKTPSQISADKVPNNPNSSSDSPYYQYKISGVTTWSPLPMSKCPERLEFAGYVFGECTTRWGLRKA
jgi:hypothetical protein